MGTQTLHTFCALLAAISNATHGKLHDASIGQAIWTTFFLYNFVSSMGGARNLKVWGQSGGKDQGTGPGRGEGDKEYR